MGLIRGLLQLDRGGQQAERGLLPPGFEGYAGWGRRTQSGEVLDTRTALRSAAVTACRRVIVSSILAMPPHTFQTAGGRMTPATTERRVVTRPSDRHSQRGWLAQMANSLVLDGNAYGLVTEYTTAGHPLQVQPLAATSVDWQIDDDGHDVARVGGRLERIYPVGGLVLQQATPFLLPGELLAQSPVELALESIGAGLAAERFGAQYFGDGAHPSSIVTSDQRLTKGQAEGIKASIVNSWRGREPAVIGAGLKWEQVDIDPSNSQFIDLLRYEVEQACRFFGVPPSMVYAAVSGQAITYQNIASSDLQFLKHSLRSWVDDIEEMWSSLLPGPQVVQLKPEGLLRMSAAERHELYALRLQNRTLTVNEVRDLEDEPPFDDPIYDQPGAPATAGVDDGGDNAVEIGDMTDE